MLYTMLKVNRHFSDLSPRKPLISNVLSTAQAVSPSCQRIVSPKQPSQLQEKISENKFYLLPVEATGKCHLSVTKKKKSKQNHSHCGHQSVCNSWSCPSQLQLLHFYPLHQNMKSVDLDFFGLSLTWGRMGPSSREEAQGCTPCASHTPPVPSGCHHSLQGCQGHQQEQLWQGWGTEKMPDLIPGAAPTKHSPGRGFGRAHRGHSQGQVCFPEPSLQWSSSLSSLSISTR